MMRSFIFVLLFGVTLASPAAAAAIGFWTDSALEQQQNRLWPKMDAADIAEQLAQIPDRIGSRSLTQSAKALLMAPLIVPTKEEDENNSGAPLITLRLKKLLAMGGLAEAKRLADALDLDATLEPAIMEQAFLAQIAMGGKQAACLDLLAYKSETPEHYEALNEDTRGLTRICTHGQDKKALPDWPDMPHLARAAIGTMTYTLRDLAEMGDHEAALITHHPNAALIDSYGDNENDLSKTYRALPPFKQALVLWSPNAAPSLQWKLIPYGLRHDFITPDRAGEIYQKGPVLAELNVPVETAKAATKGKPAYARLPIYYKTLKSYKTDPAPTQTLITDILASGTTYSLYGLLPFTPYFDDIDLKSLTPRSAYTAALVLGLDGQSASGDAGTVEAAESPWVLGVLLKDQSFDPAAFDLWYEKHYETLAALAPGLGDRLPLLIQSLATDSGKESETISLYDNKKGLTEGGDYVMTDELALSKAEDSVKDGAVGPFLVGLAQANGNTSPDRLDPKGMVTMTRMLDDMGLMPVAKKLVMESLVFRMKLSSNGETTN